jgi:hypothetical protein
MPGHPTAIKLSLVLDFAYKYIQFFEITTPIKGYGRKMVDAVLRDLPKRWSGIVVMDWSNGFWEKMKERYNNLEIP